MTMAVFVLGFSSIFTGLNFIATTHKLRAPGMGWFDMPLFVWGIYATGDHSGAGDAGARHHLVLLLIWSASSTSAFSIREIGGDPVLFQHFFWFYSHPAVYIMILPGMAIISEIIPTFSRKTIFGYRAIAYSSVAGAAGLHGVGPSHVRGRAIRTGHRGLLGADVPGRDSFGRQGVQLAGHHVQGQYQLGNADAVRASPSCSCSPSAA